MKLLISAILALLLVGCSSSPQAEKEKNADDWFNYGEFRAKKGLIVQTQEQLEAVNPDETITEEFYNAYFSGHQEGTVIYCTQNPYILGLSEEPYFGLCDQSHPKFKEEYEKGVNHKKNKK